MVIHGIIDYQYAEMTKKKKQGKVKRYLCDSEGDLAGLDSDRRCDASQHDLPFHNPVSPQATLFQHQDSSGKWALHLPFMS